MKIKKSVSIDEEIQHLVNIEKELNEKLRNVEKELLEMKEKKESITVTPPITKPKPKKASESKYKQ